MQRAQSRYFSNTPHILTLPIFIVKNAHTLLAIHDHCDNLNNIKSHYDKMNASMCHIKIVRYCFNNRPYCAVWYL